MSHSTYESVLIFFGFTMRFQTVAVLDIVNRDTHIPTPPISFLQVNQPLLIVNLFIAQLVAFPCSVDAVPWCHNNRLGHSVGGGSESGHTSSHQSGHSSYLQK